MSNKRRNKWEVNKIKNLCTTKGITKKMIKSIEWQEISANHPSDKGLSRLSERALQIRSDQSLSRVRLFATPRIAACQATLSITNSRSSLRLTSIESVMPSSHLILCCPLLLPYNSIIKRFKKLIKKLAKDLNRHFPKEYTQVANKHMK